MASIKKFKNPTIINSPAYELFILGLCVLAIVIVAEETFSHVSADILYVLGTIDLLICIIFIGDFFVRLTLAENKLKYFFSWGWIDLLSSIPAIELFRLGRLARILRILKGIRSIRVLSQQVAASRSQYALSLATLVTVITILTGSVAVLVFEAEAESSIRTGKDAIWWTIVTMTTVGYGDYVPVTPGGRMVAIILMTVGVAIFATYTAFVASMLIEPGEAEQTKELKEIKLELHALRDQLTELNRALGSTVQSKPEPLDETISESHLDEPTS
ncbi:MAG: ion transporter [Planctomycetaceae bacterium]|nr:ion transporter [Planctomycetaceae bacterium]